MRDSGWSVVCGKIISSISYGNLNSPVGLVERWVICEREVRVK